MKPMALINGLSWVVPVVMLTVAVANYYGLWTKYIVSGDGCGLGLEELASEPSNIEAVDVERKVRG